MSEENFNGKVKVHFTMKNFSCTQIKVMDQTLSKLDLKFTLLYKLSELVITVLY